MSSNAKILLNFRVKSITTYSQFQNVKDITKCNKPFNLAVLVFLLLPLVKTLETLIFSTDNNKLTKFLTSLSHLTSRGWLT